MYQSGNVVVSAGAGRWAAATSGPHADSDSNEHLDGANDTPTQNKDQRVAHHEQFDQSRLRARGSGVRREIPLKT